MQSLLESTLVRLNDRTRLFSSGQKGIRRLVNRISDYVALEDQELYAAYTPEVRLLTPTQGSLAVHLDLFFRQVLVNHDTCSPRLHVFCPEGNRAQVLREVATIYGALCNVDQIPIEYSNKPQPLFKRKVVQDRFPLLFTVAVTCPCPVANGKNGQSDGEPSFFFQRYQSAASKKEFSVMTRVKGRLTGISIVNDAGRIMWVLSVLEQMRLCDTCNIYMAKSRCACKQARYCDTECQNKHWSVHKSTCTYKNK